MTETIKVGILGATGAVGQRFIQILENHPWFEITSLAASSKSVGKAYKDAANWRLETKLPENIAEQTIVEVKPSEVDAEIVFSALPSDLAITVEADFAKNGFIVASNASAYRMEEDIPLIIPEVNANHLGLIEVQKDNHKWDGYIITNPNCSAIIMTLSLKPLMQFGLKSVRVATMQAVSGAGYEGVASMAILDNLIPFINNEEEKLETESLKILGRFNGKKIDYADIEISASCTRVPIMDGHTESIWVEMEKNPTISEIKEAFLNFNPNLGNLPTEPEKAIIVHDELDRPQPRLDRLLGNGMSVSVGRLRKGKGKEIKYMTMGHNTIRGAAGASVLNAELLKSLKKL